MTPDLEALARRAVACPRWRWMPGMATNSKFRRVVDACPVERVPCCAEEVATEDDCYAVWLEHADLLPDLTDPATLGCLLEIYDQTRKRRICPDVVYTFAAVYGLTHQKTIEALVAALEAAP